MTKHVVWGIVATIIGCAAAYSSWQYEVEARKQEAFMMKACVDAGGTFAVGFGNRPSCTRPKSGGAE